MKPNAFTAAVVGSLDKVGDGIRAVLPDGARFALFVTDPEGEQAGMIANVDRATIMVMLFEWLNQQDEDKVIVESMLVDQLLARGDLDPTKAN